MPPTRVTISLQDTRAVHVESNEIEEGNIEEGDTLKIYCSVQKGTHPITFSWYRYQQKQVLYTEQVDDKSGVYIVDRAGKEHEGGYYCNATNQSDMGGESRILIIQGTVCFVGHFHSPSPFHHLETGLTSLTVIISSWAVRLLLQLHRLH